MIVTEILCMRDYVVQACGFWTSGSVRVNLMCVMISRASYQASYCCAQIAVISCWLGQLGYFCADAGERV
jgi:hypothetical protein